MSNHLSSTSLPLLLAVGAVVLAGAASAQVETPAQSRARAATQALNGGPSESTLSRPSQTPAAAPTRPERSRTSDTVAGPVRSDPDRTLEALLGALEDPVETDETPAITLAEGETAPEPIPVALGYYVRGDKECDQVWPGEGDIAFMTPEAFTIDFGGCTPGQFLQTGPNSWRERQQCQTELGGDAGAYVVDYEMVETGVMRRTARLQIDNSVERDDWRFCETADVPENARFASDA
jgi:hypothetical protein